MTDVSSANIQWRPQRSPGLKLLLVCLLALLMSIPALFVFGIVSDRSSRSQMVAREISQSTGGEQNVTGPVLAIPVQNQDKNGVWKDVDTILLFAQTGTAKTNLTVSTKQKSLFKVQVYEADIAFSAHFDIQALQEQHDPQNRLQMNRAQILIGVNDLRGALDDVKLSFGGEQTHIFEPYSDRSILAQTYRKSPLDMYVNHDFSEQMGKVLSVNIGHKMDQKQFDVQVALRLSGASRFAIVPFARTTSISLSSNWPHPGFDGGFLPTQKDIRKDGFTAQRTIPALASALPKLVYASKFDNWGARDNMMGVNLVNTTSPYQYVTRSLKYALMFIGFVFLAFFLFEMKNDVQIHAAQYVLIGLAQCIFYLLLLAFSEHIGFDGAFFIAATATVGLTGLYAGAVFGAKQAVPAFTIFASVYGLLFVLMRLEDYALLVGAIAAFTAIALTMWMTRHMQWYAKANTKDGKTQ